MKPENHSRGMRRSWSYGAIFVDQDEFLESFEGAGWSRLDRLELFIDFCRLLPQYLERVRGLTAIGRYVYADLNGVEENQLRSLNLLGYEICSGMSSDKIKRVALQLCIDVQELLHTRSEIETFVLVVGCRDYLPIVRHIQRKVREVMIIFDRSHVSGDLLLNLGYNGFLDVTHVIESESVRSRIDPYEGMYYER